MILKRTPIPAGSFCPGRLFLDGSYFCDTIEPPARGLKMPCSVNDVERVKRLGKCAIPAGRYRVLLSYSPRFSSKAFYKRFDGLLPRITNVVGFSGILIHCGNSVVDTNGCILVGKNRKGGWLSLSRLTFRDLMLKLLPVHKSCREIFISIQD